MKNNIEIRQSVILANREMNMMKKKLDIDSNRQRVTLAYNNNSVILVSLVTVV